MKIRQKSAMGLAQNIKKKKTSQLAANDIMLITNPVLDTRF
jgi:hypothetical protein